jgi:hypothetical protein
VHKHQRGKYGPARSRTSTSGEGGAEQSWEGRPSQDGLQGIFSTLVALHGGVPQEIEPRLAKTRIRDGRMAGPSTFRQPSSMRLGVGLGVKPVRSGKIHYYSAG